MSDKAHDDLRNIVQKEYSQYLRTLFNDAWNNQPFGFICTLLRVEGCFYGHWDPFEESREALDEYNIFLKEAIKSGNQKMIIRTGLLVYCHLIEMSSFHIMLANLLRCKGKQHYNRYVFSKLHHKGKVFLQSIPPSAKTKFNELKKIAISIGNKEFGPVIDSFFNDQIRNAFVHSDYCLTDNEFRWTEGGPASSLSLEKISELIIRAFAFYEEMFNLYGQWKLSLQKVKRFHKLPNYEVLELLSDSKEGLYGFKMHFSNGSNAHYVRKKDSSDGSNITIEKDGRINFFVGSLDKLESVWKIDGEIVTDWDKLNSK